MRAFATLTVLAASLAAAPALAGGHPAPAYDRDYPAAACGACGGDRYGPDYSDYPTASGYGADYADGYRRDGYPATGVSTRSYSRYDQRSSGYDSRTGGWSGAGGYEQGERDGQRWRREYGDQPGYGYGDAGYGYGYGYGSSYGGDYGSDYSSSYGSSSYSSSASGYASQGYGYSRYDVAPGYGQFHGYGYGYTDGYGDASYGRYVSRSRSERYVDRSTRYERRDYDAAPDYGPADDGVGEVRLGESFQYGTGGVGPAYVDGGYGGGGVVIISGAGGRASARSYASASASASASTSVRIGGGWHGGGGHGGHHGGGGCGCR